ncbi:MAG: response regulator [Candidatus Methylomirabilales bacterium]
MTGTILLITEDEGLIRNLALLLESEGYGIRVAKSFPDAVAQVQAHPPDLILMEVGRPQEMSYEAARRLKQASPPTPLILMTGASLSGADKELGFSAGVDGFIPKPQDFPELLAYIQERLKAPEALVLLATCPECRAKFKVKDEPLMPGGYKLKCPSCQYVFVVRHEGREQVRPAAQPRRPLEAKILVVEDTELFLSYISDILTSAGYRVLAARSGTEALALLDQEGPDLVLTDLLLPGLHGFDLCKKIKERRPSIPVIMMTGTGSPSPG